ncbi:MAG: type IV secretion system protein [Burkholderiaceae bacterium]|nr:MAG: type IV secretion system protein [Burkholderiaceae bacterium]
MGVIETNATRVLDITKAWAEIPNTIITWVTPVLVLGLTISIMWQGYKIVRGAGGQDHLLDVFFSSMRVFLIFSLCMVGGTYATNVMAVAQELRDGLAGLFTNTDANVYTQLDQTLKMSSDAFKGILDYGLEHFKVGVTGSDLSGIVPIVAGAVMVGVVVLYAFFAAVELVLIDVSLAIMFSVGPLFLAALAFNGTASFFNTWLSNILKYIFTAVAIAAVIGLGLNIIRGFAELLTAQAPETIDYVGQGIGAAISVGLLIILTRKAAQIGADLSGGMALQIAGLAQAARWAINPAGAALSAAGKVAGAGAGNVAGRAAGAIAKTGVGQAVGASSAMKYAMTGANALSHMGGGARAAMSQRSVIGAARAGFQSARSTGRGTITK